MLGWNAPRAKGEVEQPRHRLTARIDLENVYADSIVRGILQRWQVVRQYFPDAAPAYSGGLLDAWPAIDVDSFIICHAEESAIAEFIRYREAAKR